MKKGDVFIHKDQMHLAETFSPSGLLYARDFDLYTGAYGEPTVFHIGEDLPILFNVFEPEQEPDWEYCAIKHRVEWDGDWTGTEWFEAAAAKSGKNNFIRGEPILSLKFDKSMKIHHAFIDQLLGQGWEPVVERRLSWFQMRLKRRLEKPS